MLYEQDKYLKQLNELDQYNKILRNKIEQIRERIKSISNSRRKSKSWSILQQQGIF